MSQRCVLITGAASGIGLAACSRFLRAGWSVIATDYNEAAGLAQLPGWTALRQDGEQVHFLRVDVSVEADVAAAVAFAMERVGRLDCVINNAGIGGAFGPITDIEVDDWDTTFSVLVRGVFLGTKHGVRALKAQGRGGSIINTASIAGLAGGSGPQAYSAAKAAVINFTRATALELAPLRIRVNSVSPGVIRTPLSESGGHDVAAAMADLQPWPDAGEPDHIASVMEFLAGAGAAFMTGENIVVDGGLLAGGARLDDRIGGNPGARQLVGINRGSTGERHRARRLK
ncbi:MAG: SDR family NAD(P)-dependent oxidoreductase [Burkholderiales bacterium]|nr:SDR family NAD(P)-dependent oxidoreductase [Burkholderiales bacterium]